jgi:anti-sigma factor RsiW
MASVTHVCTVGELLSAYLDGELDRGELEIVVSHLDTCLECIAEFHELREARTMLRTLVRLEVPDRALPDIHYGAELSAYLDGELPTGEQPVVFAHMALCEKCRNELYELDAARTAVRSLPRLDAMPDEVAGHSHRDGNVVPIRRSGRSWMAAGIAAAVLVAVVSLAGNEPQGPVIDLEVFSNQHDARLSVQSPASLFSAELTAVDVSNP